jgi:hypothetical protein
VIRVFPGKEGYPRISKILGPSRWLCGFWYTRGMKTEDIRSAVSTDLIYIRGSRVIRVYPVLLNVTVIGGDWEFIGSAKGV